MNNDLIRKAKARIKAEYYNLPSKEMIKELVTEVKRLHTECDQWIKRYEGLQADLNAKDIAIQSLEYRNHKWQDDFNTQDARIHALEQIAIEERVKLIVINGYCPNRTPIKNSLIHKCDKTVICNYETCPCINIFRERAVKELDLDTSQAASYLARLEDDYLSWVREYYRDLGEERAIAESQATLAKIREGKQ
jgi:hypothetical protein